MVKVTSALISLLLSLQSNAQEDTLELFETDTVNKYALIYLNGKQIENGMLIAYYEIDTARIVIEREYKNGIQHGCERYYFKSGQLCIESYWKRGKLHGSFKRFTEYGLLDSTGKYRHGKKHGVWKGFIGDKVQVYKGTWRRGKLKSTLWITPRF